MGSLAYACPAPKLHADSRSKKAPSTWTTFVNVVGALQRSSLLLKTCIWIYEKSCDRKNVFLIYVIYYTRFSRVPRISLHRVNRILSGRNHRYTVHLHLPLSYLHLPLLYCTLTAVILYTYTYRHLGTQHATVPYTVGPISNTFMKCTGTLQLHIRNVSFVISLLYC